MLPRRQGTPFKLTVTGTNWTTTDAVGVAEQMPNGYWALHYTLFGTYTGNPTSGSLAFSPSLYVAAVSYQTLAAHTGPGVIAYCRHNPGFGGGIDWGTTGGSITSLGATGTVILASKPSWIME